MEFTLQGFRNDDDKKLWAIQVPQTDSIENGFGNSHNLKCAEL